MTTKEDKYKDMTNEPKKAMTPAEIIMWAILKNKENANRLAMHGIDVYNLKNIKDLRRCMDILKKEGLIIY